MGARRAKSEVVPAAMNGSPGRVTSDLWLEVGNIRFIIGDSNEPVLEVQIKAQRADSDDRSWWPVDHGSIDASSYFKAATEALDKKRTVLVRINGRSGMLTADALRIDYVL